VIDVCTFKWGDRFTVAHVNALYDAVRRNYTKPFRFSVVTDDFTGIHKNIRVVPLWDDFADVVNPQGPHKPSCYRRLKLFSPEARQLIGERIVCLDLDVVVCDNLEPLWNRPEPVIFYKGQWGVHLKSKQPYCGAMFMLTAGSRTQVWGSFNPLVSPAQAFAAGYRGSDQGWFGYCLGDCEPVWSEVDGVYCFRKITGLPDNARMVFFNGKTKPWDVPHVDWVKRHYTPRHEGPLPERP